MSIIALIVAAVVIGSIVWFGFDVNEVWNRYWLEHHGARAVANVMHIWTDEQSGGDGSTTHTTYAEVWIPACACNATVHVGTDHHAAGSGLAVWYDPNDPTHAVAAEDIPREGYAWLTAGVLLLAGIAVSMVRASRRVHAWEDQAATLGLSFERNPVPFASESSPLSIGPGTRSDRYAIAGMWHGIAVDCRTCCATSGKGENKHTTSMFAMTTLLDPPPPPLWIGPQKRIKRFKNEPFGPEVHVPKGTLPRGVVIRCSNGPFARAVVQGGVGDVLREASKASVEVHGGRLFFFPGPIKAERFDDALGRMGRVERAIRSAAALTLPASSQAQTHTPV